ncbi:DUF6314 family protein [Roseovarius salinarum]|uniref:DUF6314 family protein n=1 Tax=Roseovarius salinarum TaxID=1981892 RepID=UPI000C33DD4B|nr:DUF6314 family protein [Roseovarius salinarum]
MPIFWAFAGSWVLERHVDDRLTGQQGRFAGEAWLTPGDGGLHYREEGQLILPGRRPMHAERCYQWQAENGKVAVYFDDGRPFHRFDPELVAPEARHDCAPDTYDVAYDFSDWPRWRAVWVVTGPRKDYRMVSDYAPAQGQAASTG